MNPPFDATADAPATAAERFPLQFARTRRFSLGVPRQFTVSPDGERVLFLRGTSGTDPVSRLWLYEDGTERLLADPLGPGFADDAPGEAPPEERDRRERARETSSGVVSYATDASARLVAFALQGVLWVLRTEGGAPLRVATAGPVVDPRPSPDGSLIAYVSRGALRTVRTDGTDDRPLAGPDGEHVTYGLSDYVAQESIGRSRGYWWSPRGDALLVARVDTAQVSKRYIADPANPERPPRVVAYPAAGTANARVSLHLMRLSGERTEVRLPGEAGEGHPEDVWTDRAFEYVVAAGWDGNGPLVTVQTRDQRSVHVLEVDEASGAVRTLRRTQDPAWVALRPGTPLRLGSGALVVPARPGGDTQGLEIGGVTTPPGLEVREVIGAADGRVFFTAGEEPTEIHVWSYAADDPDDGFLRVSGAPGVHTAAVGGPTVVLDSRTPDGHTVTVLRAGVPTGSVAVLTEEPLVTPRPLALSLGERDLRSRLYLPSWHRPGDGPLPVLLSPYAGHGMQVVLEVRAWWVAVAQWFAEQGFAVLVTDGRGTPGRGEAWEKSVHGDRLTAVLEDQIDALHAAAARYPDLDLTRVAMRGWSFSGYLAAAAVLRHPEVFHAAVAGAAPADRRLYDTHWEERFLGHPDVLPGNYTRNSLLDEASALTRPLMLVHGLADDNVAVAHTLRLSAALLAAGRPHTVLPLSGAGHLVGQEQTASSLLLLERDFLRKSLDL
ncbi:S9 family peptidase [Streptomyces poriferorum]|uniref:Prolyl oligopeptidase family serine peptidase n=1 Tax=Streptomyces poriferorum TaxID=2798799 RepID=A0ABY9J2V1_9ACTN|nr:MULTISPECIES: prolyl oligopeptidase family serine peptidase [unclassified Streptomyces]MDP5310578.1 prolyl oligopeptidase family serine peptidase [Streptomyces sp. Alt4]WLQ60271.1 prolyl oligopeptidase family serine peptidase [Streptomyces sp. Alt2]